MPGGRHVELHCGLVILLHLKKNLRLSSTFPCTLSGNLWAAACITKCGLIPSRKAAVAALSVTSRGVRPGRGREWQRPVTAREGRGMRAAITWGDLLHGQGGIL